MTEATTLVAMLYEGIQVCLQEENNTGPVTGWYGLTLLIAVSCVTHVTLIKSATDKWKLIYFGSINKQNIFTTNLLFYAKLLRMKGTESEHSALEKD